MKNIMVINMGLKSIRCIIFNEHGVKLGSSAVAINTAINDKCVEQSPDEWWDKAISVMKRAVYEAGEKNIDYITVTASASCLICADIDGNSLYKALMISDKRAGEESRIISTMPEFQEVYKATGIDVSASLMLPKIFWIKRNMPVIFEKTKFFMTPNDYLIYKLCGRFMTDYLNAVKYHYDVFVKKYPLKLLKKIGISERTLPEVVNIGTMAGNVYDYIADEVGIFKNAKIIITSYDAICSFIGSGVTDEGEASDVSGTVTVFRVLSKKNEYKKSSKVYNMPFHLEKANIIGGSNNLGGGLIEWVKQCYYLKDDYPYEIMEKEASESDIGARGLIFLPYLLGERTPLWDDAARGVFFGLERMHTRKDMTRAVFESTGFIDLDIIEAIKDTGVDVNSVRLSGGLARINLISKLKADILGVDVMVLAEFETTAMGGAMLALLGQGVYNSLKEVADKFAVVRMIVKPDMEAHRKYKYIYELYKDTYKTVKELYVRRLNMLDGIRSNKEIQIENL